jgi:LmbE family N-acetylglucosaminyl deacetylase
MLQLNLGDDLRTVLCLGCHADDIEIGCGGTLLRLLAERPGLTVHWVVLSAEGERAGEATRSAEAMLSEAGARHVVIQQFRDSYFPYQGEQVKSYLHALAAEVSPDLIFTHRRDDAHQDHRLVGELTRCAFRDHLILEYEIPKTDADLGRPQLYVPLDEAVCRRKIDTLTSSFVSQQAKSWFSDDTFWSLLRLRGLECQSESRFAEAMHCPKFSL